MLLSYHVLRNYVRSLILVDGASPRRARHRMDSFLFSSLQPLREQRWLGIATLAPLVTSCVLLFVFGQQGFFLVKAVLAVLARFCSRVAFFLHPTPRSLLRRSVLSFSERNHQDSYHESIKAWLCPSRILHPFDLIHYHISSIRTSFTLQSVST